MAAPTVTAESLPAALANAVMLVRKYRHHPDCNCCLYRGPDNEGWCTVDEARYSSRVDRLLDLR